MEYKFQLQLHEAQDDDPATTLHVGREWDEASHPWLDLADVTITTLLSPSATEQLEFSFNNLPPSIDLLPARSIDDPNVVAQIRRELYSCTQRLRAKGRKSKVNLKSMVPDQVATYAIRVLAGYQSATSTAPPISISLTGE